MNKITYYSLIALLGITGIAGLSIGLLGQFNNDQLTNNLAFTVQSNNPTYRNYPSLDVIKGSKEEAGKFSYLDHIIRVWYINYKGYGAHGPFSQEDGYKIIFNDKILGRINLKQSIVKERIESVLINNPYILDFNKDGIVDLESNDYNGDGPKFTRSIYSNMDICDSFDNDGNGEVDEGCITN